jgi:hypothetical protein
MVREAQEGSVVKNGEDGPAPESGAKDVRSVVEAMLPEDSLHAQREQGNQLPAGDSETAMGHTAERRAEERARRYGAVPAARLQTAAAGHRPVL